MAIITVTIIFYRAEVWTQGPHSMLGKYSTAEPQPPVCVVIASVAFAFLRQSQYVSRAGFECIV